MPLACLLAIGRSVVVAVGTTTVVVVLTTVLVLAVGPFCRLEHTVWLGSMDEIILYLISCVLQAARVLEFCCFLVEKPSDIPACLMANSGTAATLFRLEIASRATVAMRENMMRKWQWKNVSESASASARCRMQPVVVEMYLFSSRLTLEGKK